MGWFKRNESSATTPSASKTTADAELVRMRNKARHRLIGAVVLVLAAIVVLPLLLSEQNTTDNEQQLSVIPSIIPPSEEQYRLSENLEQPIFSDQAEEPIESAEFDQTEPELPLAVDQQLAQSLAEAEAEIEAEPQAPAKTETKPKPESEPKPKPKEEKKAPPKPNTEKRTDDGSVALALLEGRTPPSTSNSSSATNERVVVQIGAYSSADDANTRRNKLLNAGVSNAYVENATVSGGKAAYRLRVGPFANRQAAQAAQARLRSLGYENSFISKQ